MIIQDKLLIKTLWEVFSLHFSKILNFIKVSYAPSKKMLPKTCSKLEISTKYSLQFFNTRKNKNSRQFIFLFQKFMKNMGFVKNSLNPKSEPNVILTKMVLNYCRLSYFMLLNTTTI